MTGWTRKMLGMGQRFSGKEDRKEASVSEDDVDSVLEMLNLRFL